MPTEAATPSASAAATASSAAAPGTTPGPGPSATASAAEAPTFRTGLPPAPTALRDIVRAGRAEVEAFFGVRMPEPYQVLLLPDRATFDRLAAERWQMERTECWMVAVGVGNTLALLEPAGWPKHACEHDPSDAAHVRAVVTHELVHVLHDQLNPTDEFVGLEPLEWLVEGLAVLASRQLDERRLAQVRALASSAEWPRSLATVYRGEARYGLAGSLVAFVDGRVGRATITQLLSATTNDAIFMAIGMNEAELLAAWRAAVLGAR